MTDSDKFTLPKKDYASLSLCLGVCISIISEMTRQTQLKVAGDVSTAAMMQIDERPELVQEIVDRYLKDSENPPNYYILGELNKSA